MSKYYNKRPYFTSPYANISPPATSFDMARSSSRESDCSVTTSAYASLATSHPLSRTSSNTSSTHYILPSSSAPAPTSAPMRRTSSSSSSSTWLASPYRSCLTTSYEENPTSYLSDDDLLSLAIPVEVIANPTPKREMTTEEHIQQLRIMQEQEEREEHLRREALAASRRKQVRFESVDSQRKSRRPSQLKRRSTAVRKGLSGLNGPM